MRGAGGPVAVKRVGEELGLEVAVRGKLDLLRGKLSKLAGRGWLRNCPMAASPRACDLRRRLLRGVTAVPPTAVDVV